MSVLDIGQDVRTAWASPSSTLMTQENEQWLRGSADGGSDSGSKRADAIDLQVAVDEVL